MKHLIKKILILVVLCMTTIEVGHAQESSKVEAKVNELVKKYENVKGVDCMTVGKGIGLSMIKMMFNKQFGKQFMKGVTRITIVDYSDASQQTSLDLRKELDAFIPLLDEIKLGKEKEFADNDYIRSFATTLDENTISDFLVAVENKDSKVIMYMAGKIKVK
jgi:hypothetical protein